MDRNERMSLRVTAGFADWCRAVAMHQFFSFKGPRGVYSAVEFTQRVLVLSIGFLRKKNSRLFINRANNDLYSQCCLNPARLFVNNLSKTTVATPPTCNKMLRSQCWGCSCDRAPSSSRFFRTSTSRPGMLRWRRV